MSADGEVQIQEEIATGPKEYDEPTALEEIVKTSMYNDGLVCGLRRVVHCLDSRQAILCILAEDCDHDSYKKLVTALCKQNEIPLYTVPTGRELGVWSGLVKLDEEGEPTREVRCSSCVVKTWGVESKASEWIKKQWKVADAQ
ncbi:Ribosomal protein S12e like protein [Aduncisulcus paluster]|uniref:40S ribosomal protein S12 n=1 Tax=Aduncisulcus paluster TaxID=2918883 RepID=A0ABQ5KIB3_9EUKA|nr:Ribosomal protein S12e like protein [Aduncisulcus paluster]